MILPKNLQEKRDIAWEEHKENNPPNGQAQLYYKDNREYWKSGFDSACALLLPEIEKMRAALESVAAEHLDINHFEDHEDIPGLKEMVRFDMQLCRKALQSWQRFAEGGGVDERF